jgi:hypothetical protein
MWKLVKPITGVTNSVIIPTDGMITVSKPDSIEVLAYVDGKLTTPVDSFWGPEGKPVYFEIKDSPGVTGTVTIKYGDTVSTIEVPGAIEAAAPNYFKNIKKEDKMAEILNPAGMMMSGGGDGGLGFGSGGGLIGGLILGSLLRQGGGGLFGGNGSADGAAAVLRSPPEQAAANMALMQSIGAVDKSVAVNAAAFEASQAAQSLGLTNQFNSTTASLVSRIEGVKDTVNGNAMVLAQQLAALSQTTMENRYELSKDISADGEKTRALITNQYEINLQRQLSDANAAIIELRGDSRLAERTRGIEVNTTTTVNQMQQQSQQQAQYGQLANMIWALGQNIRNDNAAINVGSGTQTSTPTNTNTNIR